MKQNNTEQKPLQTPLQDKGNGHTPGVWKFNKHEIGKYSGDIESDLGMGENGIMNIRTIAVILKYCGENEAEANAKLIASAPQLKAQNESLAWDVNRLAVDNQEKEDTIKELLDMLNEIRDSYWDLMTRETTDKIDAAIQKTTK